MRLEHFRCVDFFITELCFTQNFRLQLELHEFFHAFALNEHLWTFLVNGHAQFILLTKEKCVRLRREFENKVIEQRAEFVGLFPR